MKNMAKIFVVEDNPASEELFQYILEIAGYEYVHPEEGEGVL